MAPSAYPNPQFGGFSDFGQDTPKTVLVSSDESTVLLNANQERVYAQVNNNSSRRIWVSKGIDAEVGRGTRVAPGAMLNFVDNELYLGRISAIAEGISVEIDLEEGI